MSAMRMFCFDLDDTLVSESEYVVSGLRAVGRRIDELSRCAGGSGEWLVAEWRRSRSPDLFQQRLAQVGLQPGVLPELVEVFRKHDPVISLRQGARGVLEELVRRGHRISLVSDGHLESQRRKWRSLALRLPFDPVIFTDERGRDHWKPNPWAFEAVMEAAPYAAGFVYVADNPQKDFLAPNRLGWVTVQLCHPDSLRRSDDAVGDARAQRRVHAFEALLEMA